jgi:outer membrane protein OmpA-like peptidoglycan-associated protein
MSAMASRRVCSWGLAVITAAVLSACSGDYNVTTVRMVEPAEGTYYMALQQGYADVAQWKQDERNWDDSQILLRKARRAAAGEVPELEPATTNVLEIARKRLEEALERIDPYKHPIDAALAQVAYDCLAQSSLSEAHPEGKKGHDCQVMFDEAITTLESITALPKQPVAIDFEGKKVVLADATANKLKALAETIKKENPSLVLISSFGDPKAARSDEVVVAQKRATAVQNALVAAGVDEQKIRQMVYDDQGTSPAQGGPDGSKAPLKQVTITLFK